MENPPKEKVNQEQIHGLLFSDKPSWQAIIYDLINSEQLNPWDVDIILLTNKYLEKVRELEETNFFISSKILLAASLLLRMKSEILLDYDLKSLDEILFGRKEEKKFVQERIELDDEIPELVVRTPLPRTKRVTLNELIAALDNAIKTETRRIRRVVITKQQEFETSISLPRKKINLQDKIKEVYKKLEKIFEKKQDKLAFSEFSGNTRDEKMHTFVPLLHLDNQQKVWLEQHKPFDEIWILLKHIYEAKNKEELDKMKKEVEEEFAKMIEEENLEKSKNRKKRIMTNFENPINETIQEEFLQENE